MCATVLPEGLDHERRQVDPASALLGLRLAEAELAMLGIARGIMGSSPKQAKAAANKLLAKSKSKAVRRQAEENVGVGHDLCKPTLIRLSGKRSLVRIHQLFAAGIYHAFNIAYDRVFSLESQPDEQIETCKGCCAGVLPEFQRNP